MHARELIEKLQNGSFDNSIISLYPSSEINERKERLIALVEGFIEQYGDREVELFSSPGRTELSGNHTDHNNGFVLAATLDIDIIAVASKIDEKKVYLKSGDYREEIIDLSNPSPDSVRRGSSEAIICGIADYFEKHSLACGGFVAYTASEVPTGSGLSSSAAFEVLCAKIMSCFYNNDKIEAIELAKASKYAENLFFGKPCGLMDQAVCAIGSCVMIDFESTSTPIWKKIDFSLTETEYSLCIVNTGGSHSDLTEDYASITDEMRSISRLLGKPNLRYCNEEDFIKRISYIRTLVGDRACMRVLHYFGENKRVTEQVKAIEDSDYTKFFELVNASGNSSFKYLQNAFTVKNVQEQGIPLALMICERHAVASRVHGGGFAGTVQAYVENDRLENFKTEIEAIFGEGSCGVYSIRPLGVVKIS